MRPDFSRMGSVALVGAFTGINVWQKGTAPPEAAADAPAAAIIDGTTWRTTTAITTVTTATTSGTSVVDALCVMDGITYLGGDFDGLVEDGNGTQTRGGFTGVVAWDGTAMRACGQGIRGSVRAMLCDTETRLVYVGGNFSAPAGVQGSAAAAAAEEEEAYRGNIAVWDEAEGEWRSPGWGGVDGAVEVMARLGHAIVLGGTFTTELASNAGNTTTNTNTTATTWNATAASSPGNSTGVYLNTTTSSLPSAPLGTLGTADSPYLLPLPLSTSVSAIDAGPLSSNTAHSDPRNLLCAGGQAWWVRDGSAGKVTVNLYRDVRARGVRLGNIGDGRGTTRFRIVTIPDNTVRTLTYTDPETLLASSCTQSCPLALTSGINAQDFLFADAEDITGFQVYLEGWTGAGGGLALMQLLSDGAGAVASVEAENANVCTGVAGVNGTARVQTTGEQAEWDTVEVETSISGTVRRVLTTTISADDAQRPSITYYPYVGSTGFYRVYVTTPGCAALPPCNQRTRNVQVEVFAARQALPIVVNLDQTNTDDARVLVYEGLVERSSGAFGMTVRLALGDAPEASAGQWTLVAGEVGIEWNAAAVNGTRANATSVQGPTTINGGQVPDGIVIDSGNVTTTTTTTTTTDVRTGFGVWAWMNGTNATTMVSDATAVIASTAQTPYDALAYALSVARNASASASASASSASAQNWAVYALASVPRDNAITYVGGNFTAAGNYSNIVALDTARGTVRALDGRGPDGTVRALAGYESTLFVGGEFTALTGQTTALSYVAQYDTAAGQWSPLAGGVDGVVRGLQVNGTDLLVWGDFQSITFANGTSLTSGGVATYDLTAETWSRENIGGRRIWGSVRDVAAGAVVGQIAGVSEYGASGLITLSGDGEGLSVSGAGIGFVTNASSSTLARRALVPAQESGLALRPHAHKTSRAHGTSSAWVDFFSSSVRKRQAAPATDSPATKGTYPSPLVVSVAYYANATAKDTPWVILGGNFSLPDVQANNLGIWDAAGGTILPVVSSRSAADVVGAVVALDVVNEADQGWLFVGGTGGFGWVDMKAQGNAGAWRNVPALSNGSASDASAGSVLAITHRGTSGSNSSADEQVIVAGAFTTAGSLGCVGICSWDPAETRWSTLGSGLRSGVVATMQTGGQNGDVLVAGGSFALSDGTSAVAAVYSFSNSTWAALGSASDLPGSVDALTMDDEDVASVWVAGRSREDGAPFIAHWDGSRWTKQTASLGDSTRISQLAFVPLTEKHTANGSIESDRLLLATGLVRVPVEGTNGNSQLVNSTAALFDGQTWTPLLTGVQRDGSAGSASGLFYSRHSFNFSTKSYLALGLIVLIAIAISTGLVFLIALIGLLIMFCWRPRESSRPAPASALARKGSKTSSEYADTTAGASEQDRLRKLGAIQAAIFGEKAAAAAGFLTPGTVARDANYVTLASQRPRLGQSRRSSYGDTAEVIGTENPVVLASPVRTDESVFTHIGRPTTAKYDFVGEDQRELSVKAGDQIHVVEEDEGEQWWFVRTHDGREGLVPAAYVW